MPESGSERALTEEQEEREAVAVIPLLTLERLVKTLDAADDQVREAAEGTENPCPFCGAEAEEEQEYDEEEEEWVETGEWSVNHTYQCLLHKVRESYATLHNILGLTKRQLAQGYLAEEASAEVTVL